MFRALAKKWLSYAAAAYLAFASMGMFMSLDDSFFQNLADKKTDQGMFAAALLPSIDCPVISKTKDRSFFSSRQYLPRIILPVSLCIAGAGLLFVIARPLAGAAAYNIKNTILLKLRI
jgi:hypothetical protein